MLKKPGTSLFANIHLYCGMGQVRLHKLHETIFSTILGGSFPECMALHHFVLSLDPCAFATVVSKAQKCQTKITEEKDKKELHWLYVL
jgi:hypothetical protein